MGLFHNMLKDNWAVFSNPSGCKTPPSVNMGRRLLAGQRVEFLVYVMDDGMVTVAVNGVFMDGTKQWITCIHPATGWRKDGIGNRLKRITSIGQAAYKSTGSYFREAAWENVFVGNYGGNWHAWAAADTNQNCLWPDSAKVYVDFRSFEYEIVHINLTMA